jgi:hypothetical protein
MRALKLDEGIFSLRKTTTFSQLISAKSRGLNGRMGQRLAIQLGADCGGSAEV